MNAKPLSPKVEQDYRLFFVFMTIVLVIMSIVAVVNNPFLQQLWVAMLFVALMLIHIGLHLATHIIIRVPIRTGLYIVGQGALAFAIVQLSGNIGMIYALYMALIGETIGFLGLNRWAALTTLYYLTLSFIHFIIFTSPDNALFWFAGTLPTVIFVGLYVSLYQRQTEAREKAQELAAELEAANYQLSEYAARVEDLTITAERERMARELHDTLSQGLAGLTLQLEAADAHLLQNRPEKARAIIAQAMQLARAALTDARRVISDLRANTPQDLNDALRREATRFEAATGIPCVLRADAPPYLPDPLKETLLRTVNEALTNIARHAQATQAALTLTAQDEYITLCVKDNGIGFNPAHIPAGHYGLLGIRERVRLLDGTLNLETAAGEGTSLTAQIPITPPVSLIIAP